MVTGRLIGVLAVARLRARQAAAGRVRGDAAVRCRQRDGERHVPHDGPDLASHGGGARRHDAADRPHRRHPASAPAAAIASQLCRPGVARQGDADAARAPVRAGRGRADRRRRPGRGRRGDRGGRRGLDRSRGAAFVGGHHAADPGAGDCRGLRHRRRARGGASRRARSQGCRRGRLSGGRGGRIARVPGGGGWSRRTGSRRARPARSAGAGMHRTRPARRGARRARRPQSRASRSRSIRSRTAASNTTPASASRFSRGSIRRLARLAN